MTTVAPPTGSTPLPQTRDLVSFTDVEMKFPNGTVALHGVDLSVRTGEFLTVVGPSGCGKSTLLKLMSGELSPSEGSVKKHQHCVLGQYHQVRRPGPNPRPRGDLVPPAACSPPLR